MHTYATANGDTRRRAAPQGAYRDDDGKPVVLSCVREAEARISGNQNMEYLPMGGLKAFCALSAELAYGGQSPYLADGRVAAIQTLSGTGACRIFADFQRRYAPGAAMYIPVPTWSNHHNIWADAGVPQKTYRYYDPASRGLNLDWVLQDIASAPEGSFFLLHACAHNPTGVDPTPQQWGAISKAMKARNQFALFDMAYQGFASGDCERDAAAIRIFVGDGHRVACAQSFAKNMGLYGQRIGCLSVLCASEDEAAAVESQLKQVARPMYSNPPLHGARLVATVLGEPGLKAAWHGEVKQMADRIIGARSLLRAELEAAGSRLPWGHVTDQIGMFFYSGMTPEMVRHPGRERACARRPRPAAGGSAAWSAGRGACALGGRRLTAWKRSTPSS